MEEEQKNIEVAVRAMKQAEAEIKKEERARRDAKDKSPRIDVQNVYSALGNEEHDAIFKKYSRYYDNNFIKARYKPPWKKYREGFLVKLKGKIHDDDSTHRIIDAGALRIERGYNGVVARMLQTIVNAQLIRHQNQAYIEFVPNEVGLFGLAASVAVYYDDEEMLNEVILLLIERLMPLTTGEIDLAGYDNIVERCYKTIVADDSRLVNRHLLLAGPPGCGKSMIAKRLIEMTPDWLHFNISVESEWEEIVPMLNEVVRRCNKRLLIIIDEIDEIGLNRDVSRDRVYQLLRLLDGIAGLRHVKFLATTNRPGDLDKALLRTGRLGPVFVVEKPTPEQFSSIVDYYKQKYAAKIDTGKIVQGHDGLTGCDIRTAFEDCIIFGQGITTDNVLQNLKAIEQSKSMHSMLYA